MADDNKITFMCEAIGCTNERTIYKSMYDLYQNHYCSEDCNQNSRRGQKRVVSPKVTKKRIAKVSSDIKNYFKKQETK